MTQKIAIAMVHGMGQQKSDFAARMQALLEKKLRQKMKKQQLRCSELPFEFVPVHWAPITEKIQAEMIRKLNLDRLSWVDLRHFVLSYLGDGIAYQAPMIRNKFIYESIHKQFQKTLADLGEKAGKEAPLCVISHSLGSVICSDFFKALQARTDTSSKTSPIEQGQTLALYYTMGSPIPIWALGEKNYGTPVAIPSKQLGASFPQLKGEWINFFSKYDVLGYPLKQINSHYDEMVSADIIVSAGNVFTRFTPLSHANYWTSSKILEAISHSLIEAWKCVNRKS
jgi:hypothetical protein